MRCCIWILVGAAMLCGGGPGVAQPSDPTPLAPEFSDGGEAYVRALRLRRIDSDAVYFDPAGPPPPLEARGAPDPARDATSAPDRAITVPGILIALLVLAALAYVVMRVGGGVSVFARAPGDAARDGGPDVPAHDATARIPQALADILRIADRRVAVVRLAQAALLASIRGQGGLYQDSWTARDALRHLPTDLPHRAALHALVLESERVQFGGRDIEEATFSAHVARIRPVIQGGTA